MDISSLKKDTVKSVRINSEIVELLKKKGLTVQQAFDLYLKTIIKIEVSCDE